MDSGQHKMERVAVLAVHPLAYQSDVQSCPDADGGTLSGEAAASMTPGAREFTQRKPQDRKPPENSVGRAYVRRHYPEL